MQQPRPMGRPPGADSEATRRLLLEASLEAFAEAGYEAMSVRALTRKLGVSHNLVHHYFGSKKNLWLAALDNAVDAKKEEILGLLASGGGSADEAAATLREVIRRVVSLLSGLPALPRILVQEAAGGGERLDALYERHLGPALAGVEAFLLRTSANSGRQIDPRPLVLFLAGGIPSLFTHAALARRVIGAEALEADGLDRFAESTTELLLHGIL